MISDIVQLQKLSTMTMYRTRHLFVDTAGAKIHFEVQTTVDAETFGEARAKGRQLIREERRPDLCDERYAMGITVAVPGVTSASTRPSIQER